MKCPHCRSEQTKKIDISIEIIPVKKMRVSQIYECGECDTQFATMGHRKRIISEGIIPADRILSDGLALLDQD